MKRPNRQRPYAPNERGWAILEKSTRYRFDLWKKERDAYELRCRTTRTTLSRNPELGTDEKRNARISDASVFQASRLAWGPKLHSTIRKAFGNWSVWPFYEFYNLCSRAQLYRILVASCRASGKEPISEREFFRRLQLDGFPHCEQDAGGKTGRRPRLFAREAVRLAAPECFRNPSSDWNPRKFENTDEILKERNQHLLQMLKRRDGLVVLYFRDSIERDPKPEELLSSPV